MQLKNRYSDEDKMRVWGDHPYCARCSSNQMCSVHHVFGTESDDIRKSIMLCYNCHKYADTVNVRGGVNGKEFREWALEYTKNWIEQNDRG